MITKQPSSKVKKILGLTAIGVFIVEGAGFVVSYGLWYKLNTERDFRLHMYKNHKWVLETYYKLGETFSNQKTRELDQRVWSNEGKI